MEAPLVAPWAVLGSAGMGAREAAARSAARFNSIAGAPSDSLRPLPGKRCVGGGGAAPPPRSWMALALRDKSKWLIAWERAQGGQKLKKCVRGIGKHVRNAMAFTLCPRR